MFARLLERFDLDSDIIHGYGGDFVPVQPIYGGDRKPRRAAGEKALLVGQTVEVRHVTGAYEEYVARPDLHTLRCSAGIELGCGDCVAWHETSGGLVRDKIEQHTPPLHGRFHGVDRAALCAGRRGHGANPEPIVEHVIGSDMSQTVPLRAALQGHEQHVVGDVAGAELMRDRRAGNVVRA
jgi:hypothetical protein